MSSRWIFTIYMQTLRTPPFPRGPVHQESSLPPSTSRTLHCRFRAESDSFRGQRLYTHCLLPAEASINPHIQQIDKSWGRIVPVRADFSMSPIDLWELLIFYMYGTHLILCPALRPAFMPYRLFGLCTPRAGLTGDLLNSWYVFVIAIYIHNLYFYICGDFIFAIATTAYGDNCIRGQLHTGSV